MKDSSIRSKAKKKYQKGEPYSKLKNWWNSVTESEDEDKTDTPKKAAKKARKKKKNWDFSDASLKNL